MCVCVCVRVYASYPKQDPRMAKSVTEPQILLSDLWHQKSGNPRHNLFIFLVCSFFSRSLADTIWHDELMGSHGSKKGEQPIKVGLSWANRWWLWSLNLTPTGSWRNLKNPLPSPAEQLSGASWSCRPSQQLWTSPPGCVGVMSHLSWSTHGIRGMVRPIMWNLAESLFMDWWPSRNVENCLCVGCVACFAHGVWKTMSP